MRGSSAWVEASAGAWRCRWRGIHGAGQATFTYKKDAQEMAEAKRQAWQRMDAGLPPLPAAVAPANFPAFSKEYRAHLGRKRSRRTHYLASHALKLWVEFAGERFPVTRKMKAAMGGRTVDDFCSWLLEEKGHSPNGTRINLRHLKAAIRWAVKFDLLDYDPFLHFEMPPADKVARLMKPEELARLFAELPDVCRRAALFALFTGLRIGEILSLDWMGIEQSASGIWYLTVLKSKTRRAKEETKTQAIHPRAVGVLGPVRGSGPVFNVKLSRLEQTMKAATVRLNLGRVRWHDLRHTWATMLMQEAKDLPALMAAGGWATSQAAMIYQHPTEKRRDVTLKMGYELQNFPLPAPTESEGKEGQTGKE
jgi:integrase